jgi:hypothetical protein
VEKNKMTVLRRSLIVLASLALGSTLASASTLIYYIDVFGSGVAQTTPILTPATEASAGASVIVSIPKLDQTSDPNPGFIYALSAVNLTLDWIADGTVRVVNLSCSFGNTDCVDIPFANASSNVPMTLVVGGVTTTATGVAGPISSSNQVNCGASAPVPCALEEGHGGPINLFPGQHGANTVGNPVANIGLFQGIGVATISGNASNGFQGFSGNAALGFPSDLNFGGNSQTGAILSVTYTYSEVPIPEPASLSMIGGGFLALAALIRRKSRNRK